MSYIQNICVIIKCYFVFTSTLSHSPVNEFSYGTGKIFVWAKIEGMSLSAVFISCGLGLSLSLLFFMDQNITGAVVDSPENRLVHEDVAVFCYRCRRCINLYIVILIYIQGIQNRIFIKLNVLYELITLINYYFIKFKYIIANK